jgi:hypothetical protein
LKQKGDIMDDKPDSVEKRPYEELTEEARGNLRELAPQSTTLFLRIGSKHYQNIGFWWIDVHFTTEQGNHVNMCDYLRDSFSVETRTREDGPTSVLSWHSGNERNGTIVTEKVVQHIGEAIWDDPGAYRSSIEVSIERCSFCSNTEENSTMYECNMCDKLACAACVYDVGPMDLDYPFNKRNSMMCIECYDERRRRWSEPLLPPPQG